MNTQPIAAGDYIIYTNGARYELGLVKRVNGDGSAFVYYHDGDTASKTPRDCMHQLVNQHSIAVTTLGAQQRRLDLFPICGLLALAELHIQYTVVDYSIDTCSILVPDAQFDQAYEIGKQILVNLVKTTQKEDPHHA